MAKLGMGDACVSLANLIELGCAFVFNHFEHAKHPWCGGIAQPWLQAACVADYGVYGFVNHVVCAIWGIHVEFGGHQCGHLHGQ